MATTQVFIVAGQSNAQNRITALIMEPLASVPSYAKTAINQWTGDCPASVDSGTQYSAPTLANSPCSYNENSVGNWSSYYNGWGRYISESPQSPNGTLTAASDVGWDCIFLQKYLANNPGVPIACLKVAIGGTSLRGTWLPYEYQTGRIQSVGSNTIGLDPSDSPNAFNSGLAGSTLKILGGAAQGLYSVTAYNTTTKVATLSPTFTSLPSVGDGYGIDQPGFSHLRTMITDATGRLNSSPGSGNWQWGGFFWYQGESGAHANFTDDSQYLADARGMFSAMRGLTRADLPVLVGRIGNNWGWSGGETGDTTNANFYLKQMGYPYAAVVASYQSGNSLTIDGRVSPASLNAATIQGFVNGANARRATQVTLGSDPHCAWWSNDDLPTLPPFYQKWANFWGINVAGLAAGDNTYGEDWYGYHNGSDGQMAAGERAYAAYAALAGRKYRVNARRGKFRIR